MSNMSYCRFSNTSGDLRDCLNAMREACDMEELELSIDELDSMKWMMDLCEEFLEEGHRLLKEEEEEVDFD